MAEFNNRQASELLDASEGRMGNPNNRGRTVPGHAGDHIPPDGAGRADVMAQAQRRPQRDDTTVYYSRRHAIQDLRAALNSSAQAVASLKPGESVRLDYAAPSRLGFNSKNGAVPYEVTFNLVSIVLERLPDGILHLVHMSPRVPSAGPP